MTYCLNQCTDTNYKNYENVYCQYYTKLDVSAQNDIELSRRINLTMELVQRFEQKGNTTGYLAKTCFGQMI
jgi:hypothetical protein